MKSIWAFLVGLEAGTSLALLFAPQSGRRTQKLVSQRAQEGLDQLAAAGKQVANQMKGWAEQ